MRYDVTPHVVVSCRCEPPPHSSHVCVQTRWSDGVVTVTAELPLSLTDADMAKIEAYLRPRAVDLTTLKLQFEGVAGPQDGKAALFQTLARLSYPRLAELELGALPTFADMEHIGTMLLGIQGPHLSVPFKMRGLNTIDKKKIAEAFRDLYMYLRGRLLGKFAIQLWLADCPSLSLQSTVAGGSADANVLLLGPDLVRMQERKECSQCRLWHGHRHQTPYLCSVCRKYMCGTYFHGKETHGSCVNSQRQLHGAPPQ